MMINIGFGNIISSDRVVAMVVPESAPSNVSYRRQKKGRWSPNQYRHPDRQSARDSVAILSETIASRCAAKEGVLTEDI